MIESMPCFAFLEQEWKYAHTCGKHRTAAFLHVSSTGRYWKLKTAFHRYETACQNIGFLLCLENFPRLPTGAQIAFRVTNTVKQRAV